MSLRRRVLVASEPMEYGVLSYLERLLDGLDPARWEPALAYSPRRMAPQARELVARLVGRGVRVRALPFHRGLGAGDVRGALGLAAEIATFRPDVIHLHSTKAGLVGRAVAALLRTPALYTPHGTSWHYTGARIGRVQLALERALRRVTAGLVAVCAEEAAAFEAEVGFAAERVRVVPNGVRVPDPATVARRRAEGRTALGIADGAVWAVFVGRLTAEKGADVLLRALSRATGVDGVLVVGEGRDRAMLARAAEGAGVPVRFCGYQPDPSRFLAAADVFVQPSRSEGLPFALLEAMAHGLPVVCSRVGGMPGAVGACGVTVPPDAADALAAALATLARDPSRRRALGDAARARVARDFGEAAMLAALEDAYDAASAGAVRAAASLPVWSRGGARASG